MQVIHTSRVTNSPKKSQPLLKRSMPSRNQWRLDVHSEWYASENMEELIQLADVMFENRSKFFERNYSGVVIAIIEYSRSPAFSQAHQLSELANTERDKAGHEVNFHSIVRDLFTCGPLFSITLFLIQSQFLFLSEDLNIASHTV